jgi:hypothetical protein
VGIQIEMLVGEQNQDPVALMLDPGRSGYADVGIAALRTIQQRQPAKDALSFGKAG